MTQSLFDATRAVISIANDHDLPAVLGLFAIGLGTRLHTELGPDRAEEAAAEFHRVLQVVLETWAQITPEED